MKSQFAREVPRNLLLLGLLLILLLLLVVALNAVIPPEINTEFDGATIQISADKAWSILPGDCLTIRWQIDGIESLYIDGQGKIGWGELAYCPNMGAAGPAFRITSQNGAVRTLSLATYFLPAEMLNCLLFVLILSLFVVAVWYVWTLRLDEPPPAKPYMLLVIAAAWAMCLLATASGTFSIRDLLHGVGDVFASPAWQLFGVVLGALVFIPLLVQELSRGNRTKSSADFVAVASFFAFLVLLYLPFGIESIGHQEGWIFRAYLEGRTSKVSAELLSRFWSLIPHALVTIISPDSFSGFHLANFLMFWGKMALMYAVLRQVKFSPFFAFLCTMLFFVYPVNSGLMSLRSISPNFTKLSLLAAAYLALDFRANPSRSRLLGIWLALLFNVGSYEVGYAIILVMPLLWWRRLQWGWRRFNLTFTWYLFPTVKIVYLLLLLTVGRSFYRSYLFSSLLDGERSLLDSLGHYLGIIGAVYRQTIVTGWQEALNALGQNLWVIESILALALAGAVTMYLARNSDATVFLSRRQTGISILGGLMFILPSVGVLLWLDSFNRDLWRMYIYVPIGAAIAVSSLIMLIAYPIKRQVFRQLVTVCLFLLTMLPALSRLFLQHANFVESANTKARVLAQIVDQAPRFDPNAEVILLTDMGLRQLGENNLYDFRRATLDSAIYMMYEDHRPRYAVLCWDSGICNPYDSQLANYEIRDFVSDASKLVLFRLNDDLSVELLRELPPELGIDDTHNYNPDRLIDASAPMPRRAITMLGSALQTE